MEMENFHSFAFTVACDEELILVPKQVKNGVVQKQNTSLASPKYTEQLVNIKQVEVFQKLFFYPKTNMKMFRKHEVKPTQG